MADDDLRDRIAEAIRKGAYVCPGKDCPFSVEECQNTPWPLVLTAEAWTNGVRDKTWVAGTTSAIADAAMAVVTPEVERLRESDETNFAVIKRISEAAGTKDGHLDLMTQMRDSEKARADQLATELDFMRAVLAIFDEADAHGELFWRVNDGQVRFLANVSDVFGWACADAEDITPERFPDLRRALDDLTAVNRTHGPMYFADLFAARIRKMRPQGAAYPSEPEIAALFDACGPERKTGLGNPRPQPTYSAPGGDGG